MSLKTLPRRFTAFGIANFGCHGGVVFPLRIRLAEAGAAAFPNARVYLHLCSDICVSDEFVLPSPIPS